MMAMLREQVQALSDTLIQKSRQITASGEGEFYEGYGQAFMDAARLIDALLADSTKPEGLVMTKEEVKELQRFLFSVGYISYEHFESIHELSKKLDEYLKNEDKLNNESEANEFSK